MSGWLMANEVGTGKTFTYLNVIRMHVREIGFRHAANEEITARPSMVIMPAGLVVQTFFEALANFPDLDLHVFYSSKSATADHPELSANVLSHKELNDKITQWQRGVKDPRTAANVVLTSYTTLCRRAVKTEKSLWNPMQGPLTSLDRYDVGVIKHTSRG